MNALDLYKTRKILFFAASSAFAALFYSLMEAMILHGTNTITDCATASFLEKIAINITFGALIGFTVGVLEEFFFHQIARKRSIMKVLTLKAGIYFSVFTLMALGIAVAHGMNNYEAHPLQPEVIAHVQQTFNSAFYPLFLIYVTLSTTGMIFIHQMCEKMGYGVLWQFLLGKYNQAKQEQRAFMFLDMKSSTSIAERIGSERFYQLLNDFFADMTNTILKYQGEIYQYVGDEIIITWRVEENTKMNKAIQCFYEIEKAILKNRKNYLRKYGFVPEFKAAIHSGQVTVGEVGTLKREMVFSGDVLNTTARIQSLCNSYQAKLLISDEFYGLLPQADDSLDLEHIGKVSLKGKSEKVGIIKVEEKLLPVLQPNWQNAFPKSLLPV